MNVMSEGTYGSILYIGKYTVEKIAHRRVPKGSLSLDEQKEIHAIILEETRSYRVIRAPRLISSKRYEMERIDVDKVIFLGCHDTVLEGYDRELLIFELVSLWKALYKKGYIAWDFELYLQPDGRVIIVDFDKFKVLLSGFIIDDRFFIHPCFPRGFATLL